MRKKFFIVTLSLCLALSLTSCTKDGKDEKLGGFNKTEVTEDIIKDGEKQSGGPFKKLDSEFYSKTKELKSALAKNSISIPEGWDVQIVNARHYRMFTPSDDPALPNATFNIIYCYNLTNTYAQKVELFDKLFQDDNTGITYEIDGHKYTEVYKKASLTSKYCDNTFSDGSLLSCNIIDDVHLQDRLGYQPKGKYSVYRYSILFNGIPMQIRTVAKKEDEKTVKRVLAELASSLKPYKYPLTSTIEAKFDSCSVTLPKEFEKSRINGKTIYEAHEKEDTPFSGTKIAEFPVSFNQKTFNREEFTEEMEDIVKFFLPDSYQSECQTVVGEPYPVPYKGDNLYFVLTNVVYEATLDKGGTFLGKVNNMLLVMYILPSDTEEHRALCILTMASEQDGLTALLDSFNKNIIIK